jgi:hypothetical protein
LVFCDPSGYIKYQWIDPGECGGGDGGWQQVERTCEGAIQAG